MSDHPLIREFSRKMDRDTLLDWAGDAVERMKQLEADLDEARQNVCAFAAPWAAQYARDHGYPDGHLHHVHFDILEKAGARMASFVRGADHE